MKIKNITVLLAMLIFSFNSYALPKTKKLNILILSTCSLRASRLGYMSGKNTSPNIDQIAKKAFRFNNAFTDKSWSNVSGFLQNIPSTFIKKNGYNPIGTYAGELGVRDIPTRRPKGNFFLRLPELNTKSVPISYYEYDEALLNIKKRITDTKKLPFFIQIHNKMMHFPYGNSFKNSRGPIRYLLSPASVSYIRDYETNFLKSPDNIPFSFFLGNIDIRTKVPAVLKAMNLRNNQIKEPLKITRNPLFIGLLNNKDILDRWKRSKNFARELEIIKELYDLRLKIFDESLKDILTLYGNTKLLDNTVIIFTGDHGEAFSEHDFMVHGETVYDEMLNFPLLVKFPGQEQGMAIDQQFFQDGITEIVKKIMTGELNKENFQHILQTKITYPFIHSRSCANNLRSIRYDNNWKFIVDLKNDKKFLYDLKKDPHEHNNVILSQPKMSAFLEEQYIEDSSVPNPDGLYHFCNDE